MSISTISLIIVATVLSYWVVNRLYLLGKARYKVKQAIKKVRKSGEIYELLCKSPYASSMIEEYIKCLNATSADYIWVIGRKGDLISSLKKAEKQQLDSLLKKYLFELNEAIEKGVCEKWHIIDLEKTIKAGKDKKISVSMYEKNLFSMKKKALRQIAEEMIEDTHDKLKKKMTELSSILKDSDVSFIEKKFKEIENFLLKNKKEIKEMQR